MSDITIQDTGCSKNTLPKFTVFIARACSTYKNNARSLKCKNNTGYPRRQFYFTQKYMDLLQVRPSISNTGN